MEREATEEMLRYTAEVCGKYREIKMLAEEAEAAWKQSLALMAESKYPSEKKCTNVRQQRNWKNMNPPEAG